MDEPVRLFFKDKDPVSFGVVRQKDATVAGQGMPFVDLVCHNIPFRNRFIDRIRVKYLIVVTVYDKIGFLDFADQCGDT